jgi:hypothetical protein
MVIQSKMLRKSENKQKVSGGKQMRIMLIQPNYHSGGAEIAGNWPLVGFPMSGVR